MGEPANRGRGSSSGGMMMHGANLKRRFFVSLVLTIPVLLLSSPMGLALPITLSFPGSDWLVAVLARCCSPTALAVSARRGGRVAPSCRPP